MAIPNRFLYYLLIFLFTVQIPFSQAQQDYVNNKQLDCYNHYNSTDGNLCNSANSCLSYLLFRSSFPLYTSPTSIAYLLNSSPSLIASVNEISDVEIIPANTPIIVPVDCSCSGRYYQHNSSYTLKNQGETYFSVANNTYQALTTCQALMAQNSFGDRSLTKGLDLNVPLRCACPTSKQIAAGFKYLLTYLVAERDSPSTIGEIFGVDEKSVLDANKLAANQTIFYFTPLLVPLKKEPTKIQTS